MFTVNGIHILIDVIIASMIRANFVLQAAFSKGVVVTIATWQRLCHIVIDTLKMISSL